MTENKDALLKQIKKSVNLPKTSFPMRANLSQNEAQSIKRWKKQNLYQTLLEQNKHAESFVFHDGPPYANGNIHVGHLLNKVLKDFVVRSQYVLGKKCPFTPGWDCHGLPIEHKVMQELTANKKIDKIKELALDTQKMAIRNACKDYAKKFIKLQSAQMQSLLTLADYDRPYLTMAKHFEQSCLEVFAAMVAEGIVYRKLKPVHWSIANQTALAEAELDYYDKKDLSVYVAFEASDSKKVASVFNESIEAPIHFLIWTTTPWTLPANLAIAIHKQTDYSLVKQNDQYLVIASELVDTIAQSAEKPLSVIATLKGEDLVDLAYKHPFIDRTGTVVHADYVTTDGGTGLVHIAPGHGVDDYLVGLEHHLETYCPVKGDGVYDDTVPDFLKGLSVWDANAVVANHLKASGHLFFQKEILHSYPHDWRSKTPVIFRSTEQWFISVDDALKSTNHSLRDMALTAIDKDIEFYPEWGSKRLSGMLESRPDWCISRQRAWGLPIPAFVSNGQILLSEASVLAVSAVFGEEGSDAWFKKSAQELLAAYDPAADTAFPEGFDIDSAEKLYDIFDVWFESGSSWKAVLQKGQQEFPADLYLEGSDQHRGWFHLSLLPSLAVNKQAPYKRLLTHGFIVDKDGKKMSKSQGNALDVSELLSTYGAEVARWWVSSLSFENDIKVDLSYFDVAGESYRKVRNTLRFLLSNLNGATLLEKEAFQSTIDAMPKSSLELYVLHLAMELKRDVEGAYRTFNFKAAQQKCYDFCNDTLSSFYCTVVKDCLYCDATDSEDRIRIQATFQILLDVLLRLMAPILPHTTDEAYHSLYTDKEQSILVDSDDITVTVNIELSYWEELLALRQEVLKSLEECKNSGIENSLDVGIRVSEQFSPKEKGFRIEDFFGVSRVAFHSQEAIAIDDLRDEPRCERSWKRDETVKLRQGAVCLSDRDALVLGL